jgi:hypothetical protein
LSTLSDTVTETRVTWPVSRTDRLRLTSGGRAPTLETHMSTSRKDFQAIAHELARVQSLFKDRLTDWRIACWAVSAALSKTNSQFDRDRFLTACGYEEDPS